MEAGYKDKKMMITIKNFSASHFVGSVEFFGCVAALLRPIVKLTLVKDLNC
jgi:hypothetical protein